MAFLLRCFSSDTYHTYSQGIGLGLSKRLYEMGASIIAVGRSPTKLEKLREDLEGSGSGNSVKESTQRLIPVVADFDDLESVAAAANVIASKFEKIDFLINNAGMYKQNARTESSTKQGYDLVFGGMTGFLSYFSHSLIRQTPNPTIFLPPLFISHYSL